MTRDRFDWLSLRLIIIGLLAWIIGGFTYRSQFTLALAACGAALFGWVIWYFARLVARGR
jgi:hypothetical protein